MTYTVTIQLPHGLPGSFEYKFGDTIGQISYRLRARCRVKGVFKSDLRSEQVFVVAERLPPGLVMQPQRLDNAQEIATCCCISRGNASISSTVGKVCTCGSLYCMRMAVPLHRVQSRPP